MISKILCTLSAVMAVSFAAPTLVNYPAGLTAAECPNFPFCGPSPADFATPGLAAHAAAEAKVPGIIEHARAEAEVIAAQAPKPDLRGHSAAEQEVRRLENELIAIQRAEAALAPAQAHFAAARPTSNFVGLVGPSGVVGPSGLVGPAGPLAFY
ncbi:unnamed protein product [Lepeophtheirus salmonis]|uniref:(salmon louse) hypothetical protein n=1 Tax=Lepeophtheirus salmonis TaxID=72036 RepID=A0A7R8CMD5_LEPSM|nr:unnamed protein product [Lepeophtheirus salmonis]CAF2864325.1 unnamed protein product [Lepeophtheirus salmonis]